MLDPRLTVEKPYSRTIATALDALSHALESIWNVNANPISLDLAVNSAKMTLDTLPELLDDIQNIELRKRQFEASLLGSVDVHLSRMTVAAREMKAL